MREAWGSGWHKSFNEAVLGGGLRFPLDVGRRGSEMNCEATCMKTDVA